jgi:hypothetical protein
MFFVENFKHVAKCKINAWWSTIEFQYYVKQEGLHFFVKGGFIAIFPAFLFCVPSAVKTQPCL